jgi:hypothetical protein
MPRLQEEIGGGRGGRKHMKSAYGTISALSFSVDIGVRSISDYQESRICMAQIVNDELCLIRERIGSDSEKHLTVSRKRRYKGGTMIGDRL